MRFFFLLAKVAQGLHGGVSDFPVGVVLQRMQEAAGAGVVQIDERMDGNVADARGLVGSEGFRAKRELVVARFGVIEVAEDGEHFRFHVLAALDGKKTVENGEDAGRCGVLEFAEGGDSGRRIIRRGEETPLNRSRIGGKFGFGGWLGWWRIFGDGLRSFRWRGCDPGFRGIG